MILFYFISYSLLFCFLEMFDKYFACFLVNLLGSIILIGMGAYILFEALNKKLIIQMSLITLFLLIWIIHILLIIKRLYFLLLLCLWIAFCIGIGGNMINLNKFAFPFLISTFQLLFLSLGIFLGKHIYYFCKLPKKCMVYFVWFVTYFN